MLTIWWGINKNLPLFTQFLQEGFFPVTLQKVHNSCIFLHTCHKFQYGQPVVSTQQGFHYPLSVSSQIEHFCTHEKIFPIWFETTRRLFRVLINPQNMFIFDKFEQTFEILRLFNEPLTLYYFTDTGVWENEHLHLYISQEIASQLICRSVLQVCVEILLLSKLLR